MKKGLVAILIFLFCFDISSHAQGGKVAQQVHEIRKKAYTKVLELTDDESQKFWPIFDEMQAKINALNKQMREVRISIAKNNLTDAQIEQSIDKLLDLEQQSLDIKKKYYQKFKKILPIKKVALLPKAEAEFKRDLIYQIRGYKDSGE